MDCSKTWLQQGSTGDDVETAEKKLKSMGYYTGAIDGSYGPYFAKAVELFQGDYGLSQDGIIGPKTCVKMGLNIITPTPTGNCPNNQLKEGCSGSNVTDWENFLQSVGCYLGKIDDSFGPVMTAAVKEFQKRQKLAQDGWIGDQTTTARNTCRNADDIYVLTYYRNRFGTCNNKEDVYAITGENGHYCSPIYDDFKYYSKSLVTAFTSVGINCCEWCEYVGARILRALGYKPEIYLVWIVCSDGKTWGHYLIKIDGIWYDLAGVAELGIAKRPMGTPICLGGITIRANKGAHIPQ